MHEMSIAMSIIEIAEKESIKAKATKVNEIEIEIGTLAGIEFSSLEFALDIAIKNTVLKDAKINVLKIQASAKCNNCNTDFEILGFFEKCPQCDGYSYKIIKGKELRVKSLLID